MGVTMLLITEGEWRFTLSKNHVLELLNRATIKARDSVVVLRSFLNKADAARSVELVHKVAIYVLIVNKKYTSST